jgi:hypothetical protein
MDSRIQETTIPFGKFLLILTPAIPYKVKIAILGGKPIQVKPS